MALHKDHPANNLSITAANEDGQLFYFENSLGEKYIGAGAVMKPLGGIDNTIGNSILSMMKGSFPAGTIIQCMLLSTADIQRTVRTYLAGKLGRSPLMDNISKAHARLFSEGVEEPIISLSEGRLNKKEVFLGIKIPVDTVSPSEDEWKDIHSMINGAYDSVSAGSLNFRRLDEKEYRGVLAAQHNPWIERESAVPIWDEFTPLNEQILPVGTSINYQPNKKKNYISFNDENFFAQVLSVSFLPHRAYAWLMNRFAGDDDGLHNQLIEPFCASLTIVFKDQATATKSVRIRSMAINNQANSTVVKLIPQVGERKRRIDVLANNMDSDVGRLVDVNFSVIMYSKDHRRLERESARMMTYFAGIKGTSGDGFNMKVDSRILRPIFEQCLFLNSSAKGLVQTYRLKTMNIKQASVLFPLFGDVTLPDSSSGSMYLTRRGQVSCIDVFSVGNNANGAVVAESGAGKSFLVQGMMIDHYAAGGRIWAIDDGKSMYKTGRMVGAQIIEFSEDSKICLNPFTTIKPGQLNQEMSLLKILFSKMAAPNDGLSDTQMAILERAIAQSYESSSTKTTVRSIADFLTNQTDNPAAVEIGNMLYPYARGQFARWFNGDANIDFNHDWVILEMGALKHIPDLKAVVTLQLFASISQSMTSVRKGQRKMFLVEEAKQWLEDPIMARGIADVYARGRKDDTAIICVTQSLLNIIKSERGDEIMANMAWMAILQQTSAAIKTAIQTEAMSIDEYGAQLLENLRTVRGHYSEFMFKTERGYALFRAVFPRETQVLFSTTGAERTEILEAMERGVSAEDALKQFLDKEKAGH